MLASIETKRDGSGVAHAVFLFISGLMKGTALLSGASTHKGTQPMPKIADADELERELRRLLAYSQTDEPSRSRIASELLDLSGRLKTADIEDEGDPAVLGGQERINEAVDDIYMSAGKARTAASSGNSKKMFYQLLRIINGIGTIGRAYQISETGYLMRVYRAFAPMAGTKPAVEF